MNELTKYDAAKKALAECRTVDEVKHVRDTAMAMRVYGAQSKDYSLIEDAIEIRLRAERRLGEMMAKGAADRAPHGGGPVKVAAKPSLDQLGIDKNLAHRARKMAAMDGAKFERHVISSRQSRRSDGPTEEELAEYREARTLREQPQSARKLLSKVIEMRELFKLHCQIGTDWDEGTTQEPMTRNYVVAMMQAANDWLNQGAASKTHLTVVGD